ncbi:MAG: DUF6279 family lipoprotein [SAR86 cluster bacterium]|nr:DUF6279 family lipoprotein [SAR86 cluster bacterium]
MNLDKYLNSYFFEYAEFSETQKTFVKNTTKEFLYWHKKFELPVYRQLLGELKKIETYRDIKSLELLYEKIYSNFIEVNNFFQPNFIELASGLSDIQVQSIYSHFQEINKKNKEEFLDLSKEEYLNETKENTIDGFKRLAIRLNASQKEILYKELDDLEDNREIYLESQEEWNLKLLKILKNRDKSSFNNELLEHININREEENTFYERNKQIFLSSCLKIMQSLDKKQYSRFEKKIDYYIELINDLT